MVTTIIMPISRPDFLRRIFAQLDMMMCDRANTNLLVYVDGDQQLFQTARNFVWNSNFKEKLCVYRKKGLPNVNHIRQRRERIAEIHNELRGIVGFCDYIFLLEDDTLIPLDTLPRLIKSYSYYPYAGFITGVQIGRWGYTVPGIWQVDNPYDVKRINSLLPNKEDTFQEIDASGIYCCLTKCEHYKKMMFAPFDSILGPDVTYGISLRKEGFKNYVDWTINTSHLTKHGEIRVNSTPLQKITFKRIESQRWEQEVV